MIHAGGRRALLVADGPCWWLMGHAGGQILVLAFLGCPFSLPFPTSLPCPYALTQLNEVSPASGLWPCSSSRLRHNTKPFSLSTHCRRGKMWSQTVTILGGPCFMRNCKHPSWRHPLVWEVEPGSPPRGEVLWIAGEN